MNFSKRITISANTTKANATETTLKLLEGRITNVHVFFPEGHAGLTHCQIFDEEIQIFPTNLGEDYSGAEENFKTNYKTSRPWELKIKTWNLDTAFAHDIIIRVTLQTEKPISRIEIEKERQLSFFEQLAKFFKGEY